MKKTKRALTISAGACFLLGIAFIALGSLMQGVYKAKICDASPMTATYIHMKRVWSVCSERIASGFFCVFAVLAVAALVFFIVDRCKKA